MASPPAGDLDRLIRFEYASTSRDSSGELIKTWTPPAWYLEVWAQKEELAGHELFLAQQPVAKSNTRFRTHWFEAITPGENLRIVCDDRAYDITAVSEIGRREGLEILAWARTE